MKTLFKKALLLLVVLSTLLSVSCTATDVIVGSDYSVTLVYGNGMENTVKKYRSGEQIAYVAPTREGYKFVGWCTNSSRTNYYDFSVGVRDNITLYAKWDIDYKALLENVNNTAVNASVKVVTGNIFGTSKQGSGIVYKKSGNYVYALTNNHVVGTNANVNVYDAYGTAYSASVISTDPKYDLAVLKFRANSSSTFEVLNITNRIPDENESLVSVSTPDGKWNTVNFANAVWYHELEIENSDSEVDFEVIWLDGEADHGSSGGAVLDTELNIIGIIYAVATDRENENKHVLAIPAPKVLEFLEASSLAP